MLAPPAGHAKHVLAAGGQLYEKLHASRRLHSSGGLPAVQGVPGVASIVRMHCRGLQYDRQQLFMLCLRLLYRLLLQKSVTHDGKGPPIRVPHEQQQQDGGASHAADSSSKRARDVRGKQQQPSAAGSSSSRGARHQKQQQQEQLPQLRRPQPRPHPFYIKPKHVKRHFKVTTTDGWKLHLIRCEFRTASYCCMVCHYCTSSDVFSLCTWCLRAPFY